ncbi:MAG TPA: FCD domain-containing protein [Xanthobacteraceae bacterium]|nr:FCD domain-containing protein [Xanthobacteraceae bacterium]
MTIATTLLTRLRNDILTGAIGPGEKLNLDRVRTSYGVSLSPLREALSQLVAERLVEANENRGFWTAQVSRENVEEIFWLRGTLEVMALERSIALGDDSWEADIVSTLHRLEKLSYLKSRTQGVPNEEWELWHRRFHNALIGASQAPVLVQFCNSLHDHADRYRRNFLKDIHQSRDSHQEHREISAATLNRDTARACSLLREHLARTGADILAAMPPAPPG